MAYFIAEKMLLLLLIVELAFLLYLDKWPNALHNCQYVGDELLNQWSNLTNAIPHRIILKLTGVAYTKFQLKMEKKMMTINTNFLDQI